MSGILISPRKTVYFTHMGSIYICKCVHTYQNGTLGSFWKRRRHFFEYPCHSALSIRQWDRKDKVKHKITFEAQSCAFGELKQFCAVDFVPSFDFHIHFCRFRYFIVNGVQLSPHPYQLGNRHWNEQSTPYFYPWPKRWPDFRDTWRVSTDSSTERQAFNVSNYARQPVSTRGVSTSNGYPFQYV